MGKRGPLGNPHGRRAMDREKKLWLVEATKENESSKTEGESRPSEGKVVKVKPASAPACPRELNGLAKEHWDYLTACLLENGTMQPGFLSIMLAASLSYAEMMEAQTAADQLRAIKTKTIATNAILEINSQLISLIKAIRGARKDLVVFSSKLNLTPNDWARSGLDRMTKKPKTKLEALIG